MQNITVFKVPLWKNDYHRFCNSIQIYRLVRIRALTWTRHHRDISHPWPNILVRRWCDIAELMRMMKRHHGVGLTDLCSPLEAENCCMLEDSPNWGGRCELFRDINNCTILASCWRPFSASFSWNSSNLHSLLVFSFNWRSNLLSCTVITCAISDKPCVVDLNFSDFLCGGLTVFDFFCYGSLSACLTYWWIPLGASPSACLSSASRSFKLEPSDLLKLAGSLSSSLSLYHALTERSLKNFHLRMKSQLH